MILDNTKGREENMKKMSKAELVGYTLAGVLGLLFHFSLLVWIMSIQ